ncbi:MAG: Branched-chain-amino-acid aminotransferase [Verrucomicrobiae bacterium]|nr:Branched-chain-amino-acid aminotransferase [Verrucomicrobiae bacterium]
MKIFLDGKYVEEADAKVSVFDHGLLYGDGIFEGIRVYNGRIFRLDEHLDRLFASGKAILLSVPMSKAALVEACRETCRLNGIKDGYIRLVVTRGVGYLGLSPFKCKSPTVFIIAATIELYPEEVYRNGLKLITAATIRTNPAAMSPAVKSLNYLNNIMAKIEAINAGTVEALMLNDAGHVAECSGDNVFIVRGGKLETPPSSAGSLNGITRGAVIELAGKLGIPVSEPNLTRYDVMTADECFLTGTAAEIVPVATLDGRTIGTGKPGALTLKLIEEFRKLTRVEGTPI